jgi:hypothetical protein
MVRLLVQLIEDNMSKAKGQDFAKFLASMPEKTRAEVVKLQREKVDAEHKEFTDAFALGDCYLCKHKLSMFDRSKPCPHWLLNPLGFEKRHFMEMAKQFGCFQIQSFLRWVANAGDFARNINDMPEEGSGKFIETTIRYGDLEWSFSCTENDLIGHAASKYSQHPHYHFQMRVKSRPLIRFNDFHVPFKEQELIELEAQQAAPQLIKRKFTYGEGMADVLSEGTVEQILNFPTEGPSDQAPFKIDSFVVADEGSQISGDELADLMDEAKRTNVTVASLLPRLKNVRIQTVITPGPGVVEMVTRDGRKKDPAPPGA